MIPKIMENYKFRFLQNAKLYFTFGETPKSEANGKSTFPCESPISSTEATEEYDSDDDGINVTDKRISCLTFFVSLLVFTIFIISQNTAILRSILASLGAIISQIAVLLRSLDWLLVPLTSGALTTVITWYIVYMDSHTPGKFPPTPLSSAHAKRKETNKRQFHSSYMLALAMGPIAGLAIYYNFYA